MPKDFRLPDLGEGLTEAEIVQVLVAEGEEIKEDQAVLLVETEKAQVELPSPYGGRVARVHVQAGQRVKVGAVLLSLADAAGGAPAPAPPAPAPPAPTARPAPAASGPAKGVAPAPTAVGLPPAATPRPGASPASWAWISVRYAGPVRAAESPTTTSGPPPGERRARRHRRDPVSPRRHRLNRPSRPVRWPDRSRSRPSRASSSGDPSSASPSAESAGGAPSIWRSPGR